MSATVAITGISSRPLVSIGSSRASVSFSSLSHRPRLLFRNSNRVQPTILLDDQEKLVVEEWQSSLFTRRGLLNCVVTAATFIPTIGLQAQAEDKEQQGQEVVSAFNSLFDPNEKTKSGKELPKAYLKSAREVVKSMRESLKENPKDNAKFRRSADSAKESIRDYLSKWRGQKSVAGEESYVELEKVIRALATFYSKAGPSAPLPDEVKTEILNHLNTAQEFL